MCGNMLFISLSLNDLINGSIVEIKHLLSVLARHHHFTIGCQLLERFVELHLFHVSSHWLHVARLVKLGVSFLLKSLRLVICDLKTSLSVFFYNFYLSISKSPLLKLISFSFLKKNGSLLL